MFKFDTDRIKNSKYKIDITLKDARLNGDVISVGDNQVFRTIRRLLKKDVPFEYVDGLFKERREIKKRKNSDKNRKRLEEINKEIDGYLFVPECLSVVCNKKRDYEKLNNIDFLVNGKKFVRLLSSAGNARRNTAIFVDAEIEKALKKILNCERKNIPLVYAKYNAYFALAMSATYPVSDCRMAVVDDCITHRKEWVDWITETEDGQEDIVELCEKELEFNLFDGMGVCSVEQAKRWSSDLELDYIPSTFCIRNAFLKGVVCTFDIQRFANEVSKKYEFTDLYGNEVDIRNVDIIVTKSQLKLWNAYDSCEDYVNKYRNNGFGFGVTKVSPKEDKTMATLNYQFIQATNQNKDSVEKLCKKTVDWFSGLLGESKEFLKLYMFGVNCDKEDISPENIYDNTDDIILKALFLNDDLIDDPYIKKNIYRSINKKIKDSYIGKLIVDGNFQTIVVDPYAFMEHVFGLSVSGLLKRDNYYSDYWNNRSIEKVVAMRAPLTWRSEVNVLDLKNDDNLCEWYKYITSGIILNVHGNDFMLFADADADGDLLVTTSEPQMIDNVFGGVPITYEKKSAKKKLIEENELYKADLLSFDPKIGFITNTSSTMYVLLENIEKKHGKDSKEYEMLVNRLKICRKAQGDTIDSAKGIVVKDFPRWWTSYTKSDEEFYEISNNIIIDAETRPYFFRYLYTDYNIRHRNKETCFNERSIRFFKKKFEELLEDDMSGEEIDYLIQDYYRRFGFIDNDATMNLLCHRMEDSIKRIKTQNFSVKDDISNILKSKNIKINEEKLRQLDKLYQFYAKTKRNFLKKAAKSHQNNEKYRNIEQIYKQIRMESEKISSSSQELANLAVELCYFRNKSYQKEFVWKVFYNGILENIEENKKDVILFPTLDKDGDVEYLGKRYKNVEVEDI